MFDFNSFSNNLVSSDMDTFWRYSFLHRCVSKGLKVRLAECRFYSTEPIVGGSHFTQMRPNTDFLDADGYDHDVDEEFTKRRINIDSEIDKVVAAVVKKFNIDGSKIIRLASSFEIEDKLFCSCEFRTFQVNRQANSVFVQILSPIIENNSNISDLDIAGYSKDEQAIEKGFSIEIAYLGSRDWETTQIPLHSAKIDEYLDINYNDEVVNETNRLTEIIKTKKFFGKTVLIYGEPGTGKSFWIRGFAKTLSDKYNMVVVPSWQDFFRNISGYYYLISDVKKPVLFIFEDSGDMFVKGDKYKSFESILLNLTDGLITSGREDIFLFSFNQKIEQLNEALVRPGRCLSATYCGLLTVDKANAFLKQHNSDKTVNEPKTLGELYAIAYGLRDKISEDARKAIGFIRNGKE